MQRIGTQAGAGLLAAVLAGSLATPLHAGSVTRLGNNQVNVKADRVPLGQLLRELAAVTSIPSLVIDPKIEKQAVSAYIEGASVPEAIRKTLEESGIQFLLWGGGVEPLGLYVGDLKKAGLPSTATASTADQSREGRRATREQLRAAKAEAAPEPMPEPVPDDVLPPDSFGAATVDIAPGGGTGGNGGAIAPAAPIEGLPAPVRGTASWVGADGQTHSTGYTIQGDTVIYDDPNFVSFKNSPEARARRMNMDVTTLP